MYITLMSYKLCFGYLTFYLNLINYKNTSHTPHIKGGTSQEDKNWPLTHLTEIRVELSNNNLVEIVIRQLIDSVKIFIYEEKICLFHLQIKQLYIIYIHTHEASRFHTLGLNHVNESSFNVMH